LEGAVNGVVEDNGIETVEWSLSKEILVVVGGGEVYRRGKIWSLEWSRPRPLEKVREHKRDPIKPTA